MKHTATPWKINSGGQVVTLDGAIVIANLYQTGGNAKANAEFIIQACNAHDELVGALKAAEQHLDYCGWGDTYERECAREQKLPNMIAKAIAKAEGKHE